MVQTRNKDYKERKAFVACHGTYTHFAKGLDWSRSLFQSSIHPPPTPHTPTIHLSFCKALLVHHAVSMHVGLRFYGKPPSGDDDVLFHQMEMEFMGPDNRRILTR